MTEFRPSGAVVRADVAAGRPRPRVALMSEVRLYREGLARALGEREELVLAGELPLGEGSLARLALLEPDIVLLEARLARRADAVAAVRAAAPAARVVAFAVADEEHDVLRCAEAGVDGYVPREATLDELARTILRVARGEFPCTPRVAALLARRVSALAVAADARRDADLPPAEPLTTRESEIARLIDAGLSNKEISARLGIGLSTVKNHVHNILAKTHAARRSQAAARLRDPAPATPAR